jgi:tRNA modification GTPase
VEAWVEWDGLAVVLVDTAGLGSASAEVDRESMRRAREAVGAATLVVLVVDVASEPLDGLERLVLETGAAPRGLIVALHKWDLGPAAEWAALAAGGVLRISGDRDAGGPGADGAEEACSAILVVRTSAVGDPGVGSLRQSVAARLAGGAGDGAAALTIGAWQRDRLARAHEAVSRALDLVRGNQGAELVAYELREASETLGEILGRRAGPMLLETIFSRFCVGK